MAYTVCQQGKHKQVAYPSLLQPLAIPQQTCDNISMDFVEGLPKSEGKDVIMVIVNRLTKFGHFLNLSHHPFTAR